MKAGNTELQKVVNFLNFQLQNMILGVENSSFYAKIHINLVDV